MEEHFAIDPSRPIPRGLDVWYQCLKCGDTIPSVEEAGGPSHCRCDAIILDFGAFRATFRFPSAARGVRRSQGHVRPPD